MPIMNGDWRSNEFLLMTATSGDDADGDRTGCISWSYSKLC